MDYLDIESFRSKYSDITVTAVPNRSATQEKQPMSNDPETVAKQQEPRVEITRVNGGGAVGSSSANPAAMQRNKQQQNAAAFAYASEYKEVMAKLEYTKYMQTQLQIMSMSNGGGYSGRGGLDFGLNGMMPTSKTLDANANIVDKYSDLLNILAEMRSNLPPTMIGLRAPKERLQRDITQARITVKECLLLLEKDNPNQETNGGHYEGTPTSE
ncbi:uncharacterized protein LOC108090621 [Drosophila ficusphila]|uniref:uncharacterized protein LOC108090621 n=1 Tax=Drosophila ficusphila TaxID=30025 RepID=UPI001C88EC05|nr:uncharacterized protein LOC108090621 [Drosophila ficusphila]